MLLPIILLEFYFNKNLLEKVIPENGSDARAETYIRMCLYSSIFFGLMTIFKNSKITMNEEDRLEIETKFERYQEISGIKNLKPTKCCTCDIPQVFRSAHCFYCSTFFGFKNFTR